MKTPYAVICPDHGQQFLTEAQYTKQMMKADSFWMCPICRADADWDDDNFEKYLDEKEANNLPF